MHQVEKVSYGSFVEVQNDFRTSMFTYKRWHGIGYGMGLGIGLVIVFT